MRRAGGDSVETYFSGVGGDQGWTEYGPAVRGANARRKAAEAPHEPLMAQDAEKALVPAGRGKRDRTVGEGGAEIHPGAAREICSQLNLIRWSSTGHTERDVSAGQCKAV